MVFTMANSEHLAKLRQGVEAGNRWRMQLGNQLLRPDLIGAELTHNAQTADLRTFRVQPTH